MPIHVDIDENTVFGMGTLLQEKWHAFMSILLKQLGLEDFQKKLSKVCSNMLMFFGIQL